jgi:hypothetical protein
MRTRVGLVPNPYHETKKTRIRTQHVRIKIQQDFIAKGKQNKVMTTKHTKS